MAERYPPLQVRVWGEFACFTNPAMKVERATYPVMTPSAARGILEAIFWKPEFTWRVVEIWVLKPIQYFSILRNEVNSRASERSARKWATEAGGYVASDDRAQRHTLALRDVDYLIQAQVDLRPHAQADEAKYRDQFRRRVQRGQCFATPYFGCREWSAAFAEPCGDERPIPLSVDLGLILHDLTYHADGARPSFFQAWLTDGVLRVPPFVPQEVAHAAATPE
jgi:CRISPR-associated protein Cas5d